MISVNGKSGSPRCQWPSESAASSSAGPASARGLTAVWGRLARSLHRLPEVVTRNGALRASVGSTEAAKAVVARFGRFVRCARATRRFVRRARAGVGRFVRRGPSNGQGLGREGREGDLADNRDRGEIAGFSARAAGAGRSGSGENFGSQDLTESYGSCIRGEGPRFDVFRHVEGTEKEIIALAGSVLPAREFRVAFSPRAVP
jgi:hypothetical protein